MANPIIFGKYHLIDRISAGGMAEVFRAKSYGVAGFEKIIVIKKILPHLSKDDEFIRMFLDEARISVSLSHANIVQVIDLGKEGDSYFMAMEYVHGQDLSRTILQGRKGEPLGIPKCLFLITEILKGLDYAHRRKDKNYQDLNIVHCDVSPQNILLSFEGEVKLTDFGISRAAFQSASSRGVVRGKYAYMSPEQVEGKELDRRSDVFSMGVILHELLTGKRLFKRESVDATLKAVLSADVPSIIDINPKVDPELERIVMRALTRKREDRYVDAAEMLEDTSSYMFSQGIHTSQTDLSAYLHRIFEKELAHRRDPLHVGDASLKPFKLPSEVNLESTPSPGASRARVFIPAGSGHSVSTYTHRGDPALPVLLGRLNVVALICEWYGAEGIERQALDRLEREVHRRFEERIRGMHGDLWEVNHNSLVATWVIEEDPGGTVAECLECSLALRGEELKSALEATGRDGRSQGGGASMVLVQAVHAGSVLVERASARPLSGWQLSRTFGLPRTLVNQVAPEGRLIVTEAVQELAGSRFTFQALSPMGKAIHVPPLFELVGRHEHRGNSLRVPWSPVTRILGQGERISRLEVGLQALAQGSPFVLLLQGDEGSGRGRSLQAITMAARKVGVPIFAAQGGPDTQDVTYGAALELLRRVVGLGPDEGGASAKQKLSRLAQLGLGPEEIELIASLFAEAPIPEGSQRRRPAAIRGVIEKVVAGLCRDRPAILFFEEADQLDPLSFGVLRHLVGTLGRRRLAIVITGSSTMETDWLRGAAVSTLKGEGLSQSLVEALVKDMLAVGEVEAALVKALHTKAGGHPHWTKEMVAELADSGAVRVEGRKALLAVSKWPLPPTQEELLRRRLGWLPERTRKLLGRVASLGREFPLIGAELLVGREGSVRQRLQPALDSGLLQERQVQQAVYYRFSHSAYQRLAMEELGPQGEADIPRLLANLLSENRDYMRGSRLELLARSLEGTGKIEAIAAAEAAGDKARGEQGYKVALRWYRSALGATRDGTRARIIQGKMAQVYEGLGAYGETEVLLQRILKDLSDGGSPREIANAQHTLGNFLKSHGKIREALECFRESLKGQESLGNSAAQAEVLQEIGACLLKLGNQDEASKVIRVAMTRAREVGDPLLIIRSANLIGYYSLRTGDYRRAFDSYKRCFTAARDVGSKELILEALKGQAVVHHHRGQLSDAHKTLKEAMALSQELGDGVSQAYILSRIGALYGERGHLGRGEHSLELALARAKALGKPEIRLYASIHLGLIQVQGGKSSGIAQIEGAIEEAKERGMGFLMAGGTLILGQALEAQGHRLRARAAFEGAAALAETYREQRVKGQAEEALSRLEPDTQA